MDLEGVLDKRVLVIDNAFGIRSQLESYLQKVGMRSVMMASTGAEGLDAFSKQAMDIVFIGLHLETLDGPEVIDKMIRMNPKVRIIVMTAEEKSESHIKAAISEGAFSYLRKPINGEAVRAALEAV